jgi:hypothetical protein
VRLSRCEVRDHMNCRKNDRWPSYRLYSALQRQKLPMRYICEIFGARDFRVFQHNQGQTGSGRTTVETTRLTHLYGPAVRCKPNVKKWRGLVLRICIRPLHGAFVLLAIMDIRAHPISF